MPRRPVECVCHSPDRDGPRPPLPSRSDRRVSATFHRPPPFTPAPGVCQARGAHPLRQFTLFRSSTAKTVTGAAIAPHVRQPPSAPQSEFANRLTSCPAGTPCGARLTPFLTPAFRVDTPSYLLRDAAPCFRSSLRIRSPHRMPAPVTCTPAVCQAGSLPCSRLRKLRRQQGIRVRGSSVPPLPRPRTATHLTHCPPAPRPPHQQPLRRGVTEKVQ